VQRHDFDGSARHDGAPAVPGFVLGAELFDVRGLIGVIEAAGPRDLQLVLLSAETHVGHQVHAHRILPDTVSGQVGLDPVGQPAGDLDQRLRCGGDDRGHRPAALAPHVGGGRAEGRHDRR
jgi:hypothetical protein